MKKILFILIVTWLVGQFSPFFAAIIAISLCFTSLKGLALNQKYDEGEYNEVRGKNIKRGFQISNFIESFKTRIFGIYPDANIIWRGNKNIQFSYINTEGLFSTREVKITMMFELNQNLYLSGFCYLRNSHRVFRAGRIEGNIKVDGKEIPLMTWLKKLRIPIEE